MLDKIFPCEYLGSLQRLSLLVEQSSNQPLGIFWGEKGEREGEIKTEISL